MAKGSLFRSGALAAMAAGLALLSPPVLAQDGPAQWRAQQRAERAERSGGERQAPPWRAQRQAPPPAPAAQAAPRPERAAMRQAPEWQAANGQAANGPGRRGDDGRRNWSGEDRPRSRQGDDGQRNWRDARPAPAPAVSQPPPVEQQARDRTYRDPTRDRSYGGERSRERREWRDDNRRGESWRDDRGRDANRNWREDDRRDNSRTYWRGNDNRRWDHDNRRWNRDWRRDNRYNWHTYRHTHRHIYRPGRYYAPYRNYYYRPISIGFYMDSLFLTNRYWINDPWQYRLPPAYGPYRWVRYYDDVLLVDIYSGEVVDVIRNFFW